MTVNCSTTNLQTAINNAPAGSTIKVSGTCTSSSTAGVQILGGRVSPSPNFIISQNLTVQGPAVLKSTSGAPVVTITAGTLTLRDVTISDNHAIGNGGGILNEGTLTIDSSTVMDNSADGDGGGIYNDGGVITLNDSTVMDNSAGGDGGGIYNDGGVITLNNSSVSGNNARDDGGGIDTDGAMVGGPSVALGSIASGTTNTPVGGTTVTLNVSFVVGNRAAEDGGGIYDRNTIIGGYFSFVTLNIAGDEGGGIYEIGGPYTSNGTAVIVNSPDNIYEVTVCAC